MGDGRALPQTPSGGTPSPPRSGSEPSSASNGSGGPASRDAPQNSEPRGGAEVATDYHFEAVCLETEEAHIRHRLVDALARPGYQLRPIRSRDGPAPGRVTVSALLTAEGEEGRALEDAVSNLSLDPPPAFGRGPPRSRRSAGRSYRIRPPEPSGRPVCATSGWRRSGRPGSGAGRRGRPPASG
ncbi:hypothetical protein [Streptomyces sp. NBC_01546]|uniref:hypothetical protein n=1 Tax=Streptomyces sp. NBC_01546 TaxID=2975872 RepID=UPI003866BA0C